MKRRWLLVPGVLALGGLAWAAMDPVPDPAPVGAPGQDAVDGPPHRELMSYGLGHHLGEEVRGGLEGDGVDADLALVTAGFMDALHGWDPRYDADNFDEVLYLVHEEMQERMARRLLAEDAEFRALYDSNLERGRVYRGKLARRPGVVTLENGLQYKILEEGTGPKPTLDDTVIVTFRAMLPDGTEYRKGTNVEVEVNDAIRGAQQLVRMMKVGAKWEIAIPPELAYGAAGHPPLVGPAVTVTGEIELVGIK